MKKHAPPRNQLGNKKQLLDWLLDYHITKQIQVHAVVCHLLRKHPEQSGLRENNFKQSNKKREKQYCYHGNYVEKRKTNPKACTGRRGVVLEEGQIWLCLTLTVHFEVAASPPVGVVDSSLSLLLEFLHNSIFRCYLHGTSGIKGRVSTFAVYAE